eukprot:7109308-Pyramimonas_sp.AAC.1
MDVVGSTTARDPRPAHRCSGSRRSGRLGCGVASGAVSFSDGMTGTVVSLAGLARSSHHR